MSTSTSTAIGFLSAALLTAAACGGPAPSTATPRTPTPLATPAPQNAAQAAPQTTQSLPQVARQQTVTPVDFEALVALLPEPAGWTRSKPRGRLVGMGVPLSQAVAEYTRGDTSVKLEIADSAFNRLILAPLSMMLVTGYSERTPEGYKRPRNTRGIEMRLY